MSWLHNSGWAPRTTIVQLAHPHLEVTHGVLLKLEEQVDTSVEGILESLNVACSGTRRSARAQLSDLLNEHALTLPYPPAAVVSDRATGAERKETDLLTICTVLAKSSRLLYLRDKEPNLSAITASRRIVLLIPNNWRAV
jgi:hypothetical protein